MIVFTVERTQSVVMLAARVAFAVFAVVPRSAAAQDLPAPPLVTAPTALPPPPPMPAPQLARPPTFSPPPLTTAAPARAAATASPTELPPPPPPPSVAPPAPADAVAVPSSSFEYGRATAELLVGSALSAGLSLLPYYLLLKPMVDGNPLAGSTAASTAVFVGVFALIPLAVTRTQTAIANGSGEYTVDNWVPAITGVAAEALVLSIFFATRSWKPIGDSSVVNEGVVSGQGSEAWLLTGTIALVPVLTTVLINFMKSPRLGEGTRLSAKGSLLNYSPDSGLMAGMPSLTPYVSSRATGAQVSLLSGSF